MKRIYIRSYFAFAFAALLLTLSLMTVRAEAAGTHSAAISTNRSTGVITYTVKGLDLTVDSTLTIQAVNTTNKSAWKQDVTLDETNCKDGIYTGTITLEDLKYAFATYTVSVTVGDTTLNAGTADLTIHTAKAELKINGGTGSATRYAILTSKEAAGDVLVPGADNQVSIQIWNKNRAATTAVTVGTAAALTGTQNWTIDTSKAGNLYGTWCARAIVTNAKWTGSQVLASTEYNVLPACTSFTTKKSASLEKKKSFEISLLGLTNVFGVRSVNFQIFNSQGKQVATITAQKKASTGAFYKAVTIKKLKYNLDLYTIKAVVVDNNNKTYTLANTAKADQRLKKGSLNIKKKKDATCTYKMSGVYVPGNVKRIEYTLYQIKGGKKKKVGTYKAKAAASKKSYSASVQMESTGSYQIKAHVVTAWGSKLLLTSKNFKLKKSDMGKNGWYYEKYNGKKYKFYYVNNEKQTDLTDILKLKKSSASHTNKFYIEINRAACVVTIYMYNKETKKYDIPVKTCTVCVGSDVSTVAGTGGLNVKSSYTPIGSYSICSNGQSVKYTLKPMVEPGDRILYARWATHIVGNVYFHSIAVSTQSHYALPAYRYNRLGTPASAGCIRMTVADAKWIYDYASTGSPVKIVTGNTKKPGPLGKAKTIKVQGSINYDPTDPAVPDSRKKSDYKAKKISGYMTKNGKKVGY